MKAQRAKNDGDIVPAEPKLDLDWDSMQPISKEKNWDLLKIVWDKTQEDAVSVSAKYAYARCPCGVVQYMPLKWCALDPNCGCGQVREKTIRQVQAPETLRRIGLAPRSQETATDDDEDFIGNRPTSLPAVSVIGRPPMYGPGEKTKVASFTIPVELAEWLDGFYWKTRASKSGVVTQALREYRERVEVGGGKSQKGRNSR